MFGGNDEQEELFREKIGGPKKDRLELDGGVGRKARSWHQARSWRQAATGRCSVQMGDRPRWMLQVLALLMDAKPTKLFRKACSICK